MPRRPSQPLPSQPSLPERDPRALRADLLGEYYAILDIVSAFDQRSMTVKGWSVTLSLAGLGLGFQQGHYSLFALASASALAFWLIDVMLKGHQVAYYSRMRDIEVAMYHLNRVQLPQLGEVSAPRIDMTWSYAGSGAGGRGADWRTDAPERRTARSLRVLRRVRIWVMPHVLLPHVVAVVLGLALFVAAAARAPGLSDLAP